MPSPKSQASQRLSQSQASQGTPRSQAISSNETKELAVSVVRYLLMNDFDKTPIRHSDIVKNVAKNHGRNMGPIISLATKMLHETFGIDLVESGHGSAKSYLLINALNHVKHLSFSEDTQSDMILLAIVLSLIFMVTNGQLDAGVEQGKVHEFLKMLDIDLEENHPYFGAIKKKFENFKSQRYLEVVRIENTDPPKHEYRWGIRAMEETTPRAALEFASEMYGRDNVESWSAHFQAVQEYERRVQ